MLLRSFASYLKSGRSNLDFRAIRDTALESEDNEPPVTDAGFCHTKVIEGEALGTRYVGDSKSFSGFTHFVDGTERKRMIGEHAGLVPIIYGFTAAVVRERGCDRKLTTWREPRLDEALYFPFAYLDPRDMQKSGIRAYDTAEARKNPAEVPPPHPVILRQLAHDSINKRREQLERKLTDEWMRSHAGANEWLLVDGSITVSYELHCHPHVVGVIKSHQTQYFTFEEQKRILNLKPGERSSVFEPVGRTRTPVYSWYLRLHPNAGRDAYFGLIRVEAARSDETLRLADEISRWLMVERQPLSLPDGRWDKLLYPIRDCEQYLRSIAPSRTMIEAALAGV